MFTDPHLAELRRLEHLWQVADAKLQTAAKTGWAVAFLAGGLAACRWNSSAANLLAFAVGYGATVLPFFGAARTAKDIYFRAAKLGKYARNPFAPRD